MDKVKSTVWLAVSKSLEITEHKSMEKAISESPYVIIRENEGAWLNGDFQNYAYGIDFYNVEGLKTDGVSINNWRLTNLQIKFSGSGNYRKDIINFNVIDPWGTSVERKFGTQRGGIASAIIFLNAASQYYSWQEFRKEDPVEKENSEISLLEEEVRLLKLENDKLKAKLAAIHEILSRD